MGSTGSIGRQTLEVIAASGDLQVAGLAAGANYKLLAEQAARFRPQVVALADEAAASAIGPLLPKGIKLLAGPDAMTDMVRAAPADVLLTGVVGAAGLAPTLAGIETGATLAIANKETLVMGGAIVVPAAAKAKVPIIPVDSEHSAIFQCLCCGRRQDVSSVTITSSGGALRDWSDKDAAGATVQDALNHPTWNMGRKITIDSATLMNKSLEIIEAHWLFGLASEQIRVVIHPESIVHAYVEFCDGAVMAQLAQPDMTMPIAFALAYPQRPRRAAANPLDLAKLGKLTFQAPAGRFQRAVDLGRRAIDLGPAAGAVLNGANERCVEAFLQGKITFGQIVPMVEDILNRTPQIPEVTLDALMAADAWAATQVEQAIAQHTSTRLK